jgi:hypothetical protein
MQKIFFLQAGLVDKGSSQLLQYGVLGLFAVIMLAVIWYLEKQRRVREEDVKTEKNELKDRIAKLEQRFEDYQDTDRKRMEDLIGKNIEVMDEVRDLLKENQKAH